MARTILVAGTASHVGKSTVAAGLCRLLADRGVRVAPFKAQNMSNNARAVPRAPVAVGGDSDENGGDGGDVDGSTATGEAAATDTDGFGEIGVSQYVQARAARCAPTTDMNPVLLKPRGGESQLVVNGVGVGHFSAGGYYDDHWETAREAAVAAHRRLASEYDVIVAEGAGSIAEINLHDRDLANVETARFAESDILLVADIERGGVLASLVGTLELMPEDLRDQVVGAVITKFRGDLSLLEPGLDAFEERTGVRIWGVIPYDDPGLPEEDSVSLPAAGERAVFGGNDGVADGQTVTVAVPRLLRASNVTDLEPLSAEPGVRIVYVPLDSSLDGYDAVVIPGTKNTVDDLLALRAAGFDAELRRFDGPIVGLCGGYQILGERLCGVESEASSESPAASAATIQAVGLLPVETTFSADKRVVDTTLDFEGCGPFAGASGPVSGYEIHMGTTRATDAVTMPFRPSAADGRAVVSGGRAASEPTAALGAADGDVVGCYLHGLFENREVRDAFVDTLFASAGRTRPASTSAESSPYDRAATLLREHCSLSWLDSAE